MAAAGTLQTIIVIMAILACAIFCPKPLLALGYNACGFAVNNCSAFIHQILWKPFATKGLVAFPFWFGTAKCGVACCLLFASKPNGGEGFRILPSGEMLHPKRGVTNCTIAIGLGAGLFHAAYPHAHGIYRLAGGNKQQFFVSAAKANIAGPFFGYVNMRYFLAGGVVNGNAVIGKVYVAASSIVMPSLASGAKSCLLVRLPLGAML